MSSLAVSLPSSISATVQDPSNSGNNQKVQTSTQQRSTNSAPVRLSSSITDQVRELIRQNEELQRAYTEQSNYIITYQGRVEELTSRVLASTRRTEELNEKVAESERVAVALKSEAEILHYGLGACGGMLTGMGLAYSAGATGFGSIAAYLAAGGATGVGAVFVFKKLS